MFTGNTATYSFLAHLAGMSIPLKRGRGVYFEFSPIRHIEFFKTPYKILDFRDANGHFPRTPPPPQISWTSPTTFSHLKSKLKTFLVKI